MLSKDEFVGRQSSKLFVEDESLIDVVLEGLEHNGEPVVDIFYYSEYFADFKLDFGGGVYGITCRDVLIESNSDPAILRKHLGLNNTKQNNLLCSDIIRLCEQEVGRSAYLF